MTDTDRLLDYAARMDDPNHARHLEDGCSHCAHSAVYCRCVTYIEGTGTYC